MSRPIFDIIDSATAGWEGVVNDDLALVFDGPFPVYMAASIADFVSAGKLPAAFVCCLGAADSEKCLVLSNGTDWRVIPEKSTSPTVPLLAAPPATTLADAVNAFNNLRSACLAAGLITP